MRLFLGKFSGLALLASLALPLSSLAETVSASKPVATSLTQNPPEYGTLALLGLGLIGLAGLVRRRFTS